MKPNLIINAEQTAKACQAFIKETFVKTDKTNAVIALSGGIDSATSFMLTLKALGPENIRPIHLPSKTSNPIHTQDVHSLLSSVHFPLEKLITIPIGGMIQKTWRIIGKHTTEKTIPPGTENRRLRNQTTAETNRIRLANIAARIRMITIFDQAKRHNALVVGTENYSEHLLGYFTRFGDEASDLEPLRHLYKTQVRQLATHLGVPSAIIDKPPSADLWVGQSDENEMGFSYEDADQVLYLSNQGQSRDSIVAQGYNMALVDEVLALAAKNDFKHHVPYNILSKTK